MNAIGEVNKKYGEMGKVSTQIIIANMLNLRNWITIYTALTSIAGIFSAL
jgi:hypothetical protein